MLGTVVGRLSPFMIIVRTYLLEKPVHAQMIRTSEDSTLLEMRSLMLDCPCLNACPVLERMMSARRPAGAVEFDALVLSSNGLQSVDGGRGDHCWSLFVASGQARYVAAVSISLSRD